MVPQNSLFKIFRNQLEDLESILAMSLKSFRSHFMYQRPYKYGLTILFFFMAGMKFISNIILRTPLNKIDVRYDYPDP